jgi:cysteinyl-tRNA synthetase
MTRAFTQAYDSVQVLPPTAEPRVTGSLPSIVALVERILERGTRTSPAATSTSPCAPSRGTAPCPGRTRTGCAPRRRRSRHGHTGEKRDPLDFALWKAAKPGEPSWPSPWGPGRPGWHIECSAMAVDHLGESFDLHAGGIDLVFPHHENELAQSTCAGHGFAQHWLHHGLVTVAGGSGEKMSKSLGNSTLVEDVLQTVRPQVLRYALGAGHYRSPLEWSPQAVADAEAAYGRIETFVRNATEATQGVEPAAGPASWDDFAARSTTTSACRRRWPPSTPGVRAGNALLAAGELPALAGTLRTSAGCSASSRSTRSRSGPRACRASSPGRRRARGGRGGGAGRRPRPQGLGPADALRDRLNASGIVLEDTMVDGVPGVRWRLAT